MTLPRQRQVFICVSVCPCQEHGESTFTSSYSFHKEHFTQVTAPEVSICQLRGVKWIISFQKWLAVRRIGVCFCWPCPLYHRLHALSAFAVYLKMVGLVPLLCPDVSADSLQEEHSVYIKKRTDNDKKVLIMTTNILLRIFWYLNIFSPFLIQINFLFSNKKCRVFT